MFKVSANNIITMERGDYGSFQVRVDLGTPTCPKPYTLEDDDTLYFGVMENNQPFEVALIRKAYTASDFVDGLLTIEIKPSDTMRLLPGTYYYEIKLRCLDEDQHIIQNGLIPSRVYTILPKTKFIIWE